MSHESLSTLSRRGFLQTAAAAGAIAGLGGSLTPQFLAQNETRENYPEIGTLVPDDGWRLWVDEKAAWAEDEIFMPEHLSWQHGVLYGKEKPLPVNAPTGGWDVLSAANGKAIVLPTSVEQHFWGKYGSRPYTPEEYRYAAPAQNVAPPADDSVPQNGAYFGVSWWYRSIEIPAAYAGKRVLLHIRGAHLRAEVYLNGKLCGYSIIEELPFEADLTHAANPGGENLLAIRITNPFGRFDWVDGLNAKWGAVSLFRSHGFGALDRGITISAHGPSRIADMWVLNTPETRTVKVRWTVESSKEDALKLVPPSLHVIDPRTGKLLQAKVRAYIVGTGGEEVKTAHAVRSAQSGLFLTQYGAEVTCDEAALWDIDQPNLYHLALTIAAGETRTVAFGFRWFAPEGIGSNALFRLNGRRIRIYTSISWGFWGLNGIFPVPELAEKEVVAAKALGLNCLNFHRNLAKEDVMRKHDELGVLRYMEPGGGKMAIGKMPAKIAPNAAGIVPEDPKTEAERFAQHYTFVKCVEMVKAHRSHPSLIEYCLQNEIGADLNNPATTAILKAMHDEDPSRCVVLNDGFVARGAAQAWYEPYKDTLHRSDKTKAGDWWNNHQGAGDQWYDEFYKSPTEYTYRAPYKDVLTEYGEMEGCARPDVHGLMIEQITKTYKRYGGDSYDLIDHQEIVAGYEKFLDKWGFRKAFASSDRIFLAVGKTCYESWMNYMENARISDELDFAAISGWESTAIENHSGIVDNLRNFKSDPKLIAGSLLPVRPIAKQRSLVVPQGKPAVFDLYLANDTSVPVAGSLTFTMVTPGGRKQDLLQISAPPHEKDKFSYLLKEGVETPVLEEEGLYRFRFALSSLPANTQTKEIWVTKTNLPVSGRNITVAVAGVTPAVRKRLSALHGIQVVDFAAGVRADVIVTSGLIAGASGDQSVGETTGESMPVTKPGRKPEPGEETATNVLGKFAPGILDAVRSGTPLLAMPQADSLSEGLAKELSAAGAFTYHGAVGDFRAPWMGNWYFVREHALFEGLPVNQAMGSFYQAKGRPSNGLLIDGPNVEVVVGYSRDHDRNVGAGCFTTKLGQGKVVYSRIPDAHPITSQRMLRNFIAWLVK